MESVVFFSRDINRDINKSHVKEQYYRLKLDGFVPEINQIEYLTGDVTQKCQLEKIEIIPVDSNKGISLSNWEIKRTQIPWGESLKALVDGQHRYIALLLLKEIEPELYSNFDFEAASKKCNLPEIFSIPEFIAKKNSGRAWTPEDDGAIDRPSGDEYVDMIAAIYKKENLPPQVCYDIYSLRTGILKVSLVKKMRDGLRKLPKSIELNESSMTEGDKIYQALKENEFMFERYNNTKFSGGMKMFYKESGIPIDKLVELISKINIDKWGACFTVKPGNTAEARFYKDGFTKLRELVNQE
ncbi:hypothetical protein [Parabacteroides sp. FAFU027]|uniref:hypothetical protein n=1 Tax=Parabacteroides sp. FAFU027 TaxID=2922715 RepID=UPI001FAFAC5E|nr:hypothetical protein [Parabacteroides sp. FAFU027]